MSRNSTSFSASLKIKCRKTDIEAEGQHKAAPQVTQRRCLSVRIENAPLHRRRARPRPRAPRRCRSRSCTRPQNPATQTARSVKIKTMVKPQHSLNSQNCSQQAGVAGTWMAWTGGVAQGKEVTACHLAVLMLLSISVRIVGHVLRARQRVDQIQLAPTGHSTAQHRHGWSGIATQRPSLQMRCSTLGLHDGALVLLGDAIEQLALQTGKQHECTVA